MNPDWSLLPPELLQMISEKVMSISDFVRFRAVCNTWRSSSWPRPQHLPPQLPWLIRIFPRGPDKESNHGSMLSVYDLSQSRTHILDLPEIKDKRICGSSNGWLILVDQEVWLFNLVTRDQMSLPSLYAEPNSFMNNSGESRMYYSLYPGHFHINNVILSSNPGIDPDCLVLALFEEPWELAFCKIGDECWTVISDRAEHQPEENVVDIGYHNGLFYSINYDGHVRICDIHSPSYKVIIPEQAFNYICPVEGGNDEQGLMILCLDYSNALEYSPVNIHSIMTWSEKKKNWLDLEEEQANSNILFLGFGNHFNCISHPIANMKLEGWEGNSMCYISYESECIENEDWSSCNIKLFGLKNGRERTLASHLRFITSEKYKYIYRRPSFFWLTPSLC